MSKFFWFRSAVLTGIYLLAMMGNATTLPGKFLEPARMGSHGMAVFGGRDGLYASHLPMFHTPHDVQLILQFHLLDQKKDLALRTELAQKPELWTLEPEAFDLARLAPGHTNSLHKFSAGLVQGHFERGGKLRFDKQTIIVDKVILFRTLSSEPRSHTEGLYHVVGNGEKHFLIKQIDRRPDFDIIISFDNAQTNRAFPATIVLPGDSMLAPDLAFLRTALSEKLLPKVHKIQTIYFETEDLK